MTSLLFSSSAIAQTRLSLELKDKSKLEGELIALEGDKVRLKLSFEGGSAEATRKLDEFTPKSVFSIRFHSFGDEDYLPYVDLAEWSATNGLWSEARTAIRRARAIVKSGPLDRSKLMPAVERALAVTETVLKGLVREGNTKEARSILTQIAHSDEQFVSAERKQRFVDLVDGEVVKIEEATTTDREKKEDAAAVAARRKEFEPAAAQVQKGREMHRKGLLASKSFSTANSTFDNAIREFDGAIKKATDLQKKLAKDPGAVQHAQDLQHAAEEGKIGSLLAKASLELTRGKYTHAMANVNAVIAIDPQNQQALAARARIEVAANSDDWGVGGLR